MSVAATRLNQSLPVQAFAIKVTGLSNGKNTLNFNTLLGVDWPTDFVPQGVIIQPIKDGSNTAAGGFMYDPATLSNTVVDIYLVVSSTTADVILYIF